MTPMAAARQVVGDIANRTSQVADDALTFIIAAGWTINGAVFQYSDMWQFIINMSTHHRDLRHGLPDPEFT
jgi:low affinity Fe/Cu permease